ncbi:MAG: cell division protein ZapA [Deltaproteobacteria bacterium]|nr:cell division protein ZapA [Deltaproteobacteria bacterium]
MAVTITLRGRHYTVRSDEPEEDVLRLARWLDDRIAEMAERTPGVDGETVALLAALNVASEYSRFRRKVVEDLSGLDRDLSAVSAILEVTLPDGGEVPPPDAEAEAPGDPGA